MKQVPKTLNSKIMTENGERVKSELDINLGHFVTLSLCNPPAIPSHKLTLFVASGFICPP